MDWERLGKAVVGAAKNAADTAVHATVHASKVVAGELQTLGSARCLLPYTIENLITNSYSGWAIYRARSKDPNNPANPPVVAAWILDKRNCSKEHLDASKHEMASLTKIKHPSILRVVSPLEETRQQFVVLTEMITSSVDDVIKGGDRLDELEMKLGLLQLAEALQFLHVNAGLVHAGVCPANVFISAQDGEFLFVYEKHVMLCLSHVPFNSSLIYQRTAAAFSYSFYQHFIKIIYRNRYLETGWILL